MSPVVMIQQAHTTSNHGDAETVCFMVATVAHCGAPDSVGGEGAAKQTPATVQLHLFISHFWVFRNRFLCGSCSCIYIIYIIILYVYTVYLEIFARRNFREFRE